MRVLLSSRHNKSKFCCEALCSNFPWQPDNQTLLTICTLNHCILYWLLLVRRLITTHTHRHCYLSVVYISHSPQLVSLCCVCLSVFAYLFTGGSICPKGMVQRESANVMLEKQRNANRKRWFGNIRQVCHSKAPYECVCFYYWNQQVERVTLRKYLLDSAYIIKMTWKQAIE